jgi:hypothetical protein
MDDVDSMQAQVRSADTPRTVGFFRSAIESGSSPRSSPVCPRLEIAELLTFLFGVFVDVWVISTEILVKATYICLSP